MRMFYHRRSIRMKNYDYSTIGCYYITLCINDRENILGDIEDNVPKLSVAGKLIEKEWLNLPNRYNNIYLDEYIIMPNHLHGIIATEKFKNYHNI